jgi:deoxyribonuclease-1-like protein
MLELKAFGTLFGLWWLLAGVGAAAQAPAATVPAASAASIAAPPAGGSLRLATFNIQVFGAKKAGRRGVMRQLAQIVQRYDLVAIQEVKDAKQQVCRQLLALINASGADFDFVLSPRTGLQSDDRSSQEQYAYFFRKARVRVAGEPVLYDDSAHDYFQREPYLTRFELDGGREDLVLINIHTRPRSALAEIAALEAVFVWARAHFAAEQDFIALGDFNAGCGYASEDALDALPLHGQAYDWVVPHSADTNLAKASCPYDRIVVASPRRDGYVLDWGVDRAFSDRAVSDHWPVWVELGLGP